MTGNQLVKACRKENYIRSNYFSDTYRAKLTISGSKVQRNIVHISLPFDSSKEAAFKLRYNMSDEDMYEFYTTFANNLKKAWQLEDEIRKDPERLKQLSKVHVFREDICIIPKQGIRGSDIFIQYPVTEDFEAVSGITDEGANKKDILKVGIRLLQILNTENEESIQSFYYDSEILVSAKNGEKQTLKSQWLIYSGDGKINTLPTKNLILRAKSTAGVFVEKIEERRKLEQELDEGYYSVPERNAKKKQIDALSGEIKKGGSRLYDLSGEMAVCKMMWMMLNGMHYTSQISDLETKSKGNDSFDNSNTAI